MEAPLAGDRGNVMCSCVPRHTQVSTKGAQSYSLYTCLPGMLWFRGHASVPELTYLGHAMLATPVRQPCWGGISGALPAPGRIQRLVLLVWKLFQPEMPLQPGHVKEERSQRGLRTQPQE